MIIKNFHAVVVAEYGSGHLIKRQNHVAQRVTAARLKDRLLVNCLMKYFDVWMLLK
jgi:hypothetical protein